MTITVKVCERTKQEMNEFFEDYKRPKTPAYAIFQADDADTVVTLYESGKAVFQGNDADLSSQFWIERERHNNPTKKVEVTNSENKKKEEKVKETINPKIYYSTSIGSDEVGTGDYFGPIVVCAAYVKKEDIPFLEELGVKDSKMLTDEKILEIVPKFINKITYECIILSNKEFNEKYLDGYNMNKLKAILHNKALYTLKNKIDYYDYIVVDQFAEKYIYYSYLKQTNLVVKDITFMTKAENKCLAVACASLISRYVFLKQFAKISKEVGELLPKGASTEVDKKAAIIAQKYGIDKLKEIAKYNFKNTEKVKELLNK